jgi:hypothetical protein
MPVDGIRLRDLLPDQGGQSRARRARRPNGRGLGLDVRQQRRPHEAHRCCPLQFDETIEWDERLDDALTGGPHVASTDVCHELIDRVRSETVQNLDPDIARDDVDSARCREPDLEPLDRLSERAAGQWALAFRSNRTLLHGLDA